MIRYKITFESGIILTASASGLNKTRLRIIIENNLQKYKYDMKISKIEVMGEY